MRIDELMTQPNWLHEETGVAADIGKQIVKRHIV